METENKEEKTIKTPRKKPGPKSTKTKVKGIDTRQGTKLCTFDNNPELHKIAVENSHSEEAEAKRKATRALNKATNAMVQGEILNCIRNAMTSTEEGRGAWFERFVTKYLAEAENDPNSRPAQLLASNIFATDLLEKLDAEREKMIARDVAFSRYRLSQTLFDKQKQVLEDRQTKYIVNISGRRAGKTELNARKIVDTCLTPNSPVCYIHLTFENGVAQCYDKVVEVANAIGFVIKSESKNTGIIEFANGSVVRFRGNANKNETEKVRGFKYRLVIIDECQSQRGLKYLVEDIVQPLLLDFADSQLMLTGTPPRVPHTFFEDAYNGNEYKSYHWDMRDNPYIPNVQEALKEICDRKGLTMDSPLIQREYLGLIVYDTEALLFKDYKTYEGEIPSNFNPDRVYIGVDFGFSDYNAVISLVADLQQKKAYVLRESKFNKATVNDIIDDVRKAYSEALDFVVRNNPNAEIPGAVSCYCDTNEQSISYTLSTTYGLPTWNAYKYDKMFALEQLAEFFRTGRILIKSGGALADECERTIKKRDEETDAILNELDDDVFHPDAMFALLYASRQFFYEIGEEAGGESTSLRDGEI